METKTKEVSSYYYIKDMQDKRIDEKVAPALEYLKKFGLTTGDEISVIWDGYNCLLQVDNHKNVRIIFNEKDKVTFQVENKEPVDNLWDALIIAEAEFFDDTFCGIE